MDEVCAECDLCEKQIYYGNVMVSINRNVEQMDLTEECPDGEVTVVDSDELITLCGSCGNRFGADLLRELIGSTIVAADNPQ